MWQEGIGTGFQQCVPPVPIAARQNRKGHPLNRFPFLLGYAFGIRVVHTSKTKSDAHDAEVRARLLRGGNFPLANAYPSDADCAICCGPDCDSFASAPNSTATSIPCIDN